jgi:thiamine-phosphate pyrophosphorylase
VILPRLHIVTDDRVLARADFLDVTHALLAGHGASIALHLRGRATPARILFTLAEALTRQAGGNGGTVIVNDRADIALAAGAHGVHLGERSIPPADARTLLPRALLGRSVHTAEGIAGVARWTDFLFLGTIYPTPSHPDAPVLGPEPIAEAAGQATVPVLGIGGITPERAPGVIAAGGYGVAVIRGVWEDPDPCGAVGRYLEAIVVR